jgi:opacity protein-like surface antigen
MGKSRWRTSLPAAMLVGASVGASADDEIQVYTGEMVDVGKWTAQHHFNYAIQGRKEPDFPGGLVPNHALNATQEWAYGVTNWFEAGFYVPWAIDKDGVFYSNAMKLRTLFATPDAGKQTFFYGLNLEYDYLMPKFSDTRWGMEIRPIIGWRWGEGNIYEFIVNPIVDVGFGSKGEVTFAPNMRLARNFGEDLAFAVEYYTDLGPLAHFLPLKEQGHNVYGVVDFKVSRFEIEFGVGYGLTNPGSDRWMTKLMVTTNLFDSPEDEKKNGSQKVPMVTKGPAKRSAETKTPAEPAHNYSGCYVGGYAGGTHGADLKSTDPISTGGAIPAGTFYNAPAANAANGGAFDVKWNNFATGGGTFGCNWHASGSRFVFGAESETGYMRLNGRAINPYSPVDTVDDTVVGSWFGAIAGRAGWAMDRAWFYGKLGAGFADVKSRVVDDCSGAPCGAGLLSAAKSETRAFWVGGAGIEWAWTGNWTLKSEYLFLGLNDTYAVCGAGGGAAAGSTFCSNHTLDGIHTLKLGLNYKVF